MIQTWRLDTQQQTFVLGALDHGMASVIYWGAKLPLEEDLELLCNMQIVDVTGGMLDANPDVSICPSASTTFPGQVGLILRDQKSSDILPKFQFEKADEAKQSITLCYRDKANGLDYKAAFSVFDDSNVITAQAFLKSSTEAHLSWFSAPVIPATQLATHMIDFAGRWCREFQPVETDWSAGIRMRESRTGRTGHEHFPALVLPENGTCNTKGIAYAFHYGWSGGHKMIAEELPDGRRQIQFGNAANSELQVGQNFETAPLYLAYSDQGTNGCAAAFQRHIRKHIVKFPDVKRPRPVHYNCWEAVYFKHSLPELKEIATRAAALGAERFVLDDGWFGTRDNDKRALSDWDIDLRKYPDGLKPLIDHVKAEGMTFGIWFEPEMVNPVSKVYETNPEWALGDKDQILGRHQKVLNMAMPDVREYLYDKISAILSTYEIDYIKWDHNRVLPIPDAAQIRGTYSLLNKLRSKFPDVEIESCASGGGRIDFGILQHTHRVWLSDSNDALERARIQHNAAMFLPSNITGSHVGPRICHTSGRSHSMAFRAWIAAQRHMGFEMDPRELTDDEEQTLKRVTKWWKGERNWLMEADILRLDSSDASVLAEMHLSQDQQQFVMFANKIDSSLQISPRPMRLSALVPDRNYHITLVNRDEVHHLSRGTPKLKFDDVILSGQYLMQHGISLPWSFPNQSWVIKGTIQT